MHSHPDFDLTAMAILMVGQPTGETFRLRSALQSLGAAVPRPITTASRALELLDNLLFDLAVVSLDARAKETKAVLALLRVRHVPIAVIGWSESEALAAHASATLADAHRLDDLIQALGTRRNRSQDLELQFHAARYRKQ